MKKHKIAYIDEQNQDIIRFQSRVYQTFDVLGFLPKPDLEAFVEELLDSDAEAFVVDFRLNIYRDAVKAAITYNGADLIKRILNIRKGFPCFLLTSYDNDAVQEIEDVNYVYPKKILEEPLGQITFAEKIRIQIEHYQIGLRTKEERFHQLLGKSDMSELSEAEENELLKLDSFLESALNDHNALPEAKKSRLALGKVAELITSTNELLEMLRQGQS